MGGESMGSVKDLKILEKPVSNSMGRGRFVYSDRYSVFDWGEMPDQIPNKGAAIAVLGAYFFEKLEEWGIPTHYIGLVEGNKTKRLSEIKKPVNTMEFKLLHVKKPALNGNVYDYSCYNTKSGGFLIPLEVIYRNFLPEGSSVFKRLERGEITPSEMGLDEKPIPGQKIFPPFLDVSTKLEITDRYMSWDEAREISGMSEDEIVDIKLLSNKINALISREVAKAGLLNEDGKMEYGYDMDRRLIVVDVLGTLDECRFTYRGLPISKEIARIHYRNTEWHKAIEDAKKKDRQRWKEICKLKPQPLPEAMKKGISQIYCACTNEITQNEWFKDVPPLKEILKEMNAEGV
jgi:phosphoribosylaminoimidazole-succinocarboxamide synthase